MPQIIGDSRAIAADPHESCPLYDPLVEFLWQPPLLCQGRASSNLSTLNPKLKLFTPEPFLKGKKPAKVDSRREHENTEEFSTARVATPEKSFETRRGCRQKSKRGHVRSANIYARKSYRANRCASLRRSILPVSFLGREFEGQECLQSIGVAVTLEYYSCPDFSHTSVRTPNFADAEVPRAHRMRGCGSISVDQFLDAPRQSKIAIVIEDTGVLGQATIDERGGSCLRVITVPAHDIGSPHNYFAGTIRRQVAASLVDDRLTCK